MAEERKDQDRMTPIGNIILRILADLQKKERMRKAKSSTGDKTNGDKPGQDGETKENN